MSYTKNFAIWLAQAIYRRKMSDEQIVFAVRNYRRTIDTEELKDQIRAVRDNPQLYKELGQRQIGDVYSFFREMREEVSKADPIGDNDDMYLP